MSICIIYMYICMLICYIYVYMFVCVYIIFNNLVVSFEFQILKSKTNRFISVRFGFSYWVSFACYFSFNQTLLGPRQIKPWWKSKQVFLYDSWLKEIHLIEGKLQTGKTTDIYVGQAQLGIYLGEINGRIHDKLWVQESSLTCFEYPKHDIMTMGLRLMWRVG